MRMPIVGTKQQMPINVSVNVPWPFICVLDLKAFSAAFFGLKWGILNWLQWEGRHGGE